MATGILSQVRRTALSVAIGLVVALAGAQGAALGEGLLRIADCRIVDDNGPVKAMGVNYVDGFWQFASDGRREAYLPALDALAAAQIPFIRMAFGPWAPIDFGKPPSPAIIDFVAHRELYFERLDAFLDDAKARHIGVVLDVFWGVDPYAIYFGDPPSAWSDPNSKTFAFLRDVVGELGQRRGTDPTIWMVEFLNEGDLLIDFPAAPHSRSEFIALIDGLADALRAAGDRHLIDTGNSLPRPAAEHLDELEGWKTDAADEFLRALDAETPARFEVASVHIYPEEKPTRPWDDGDILQTLPILEAHSRKSCQPVFVGEFGSTDPTVNAAYIERIARSDIPMAAVWGFGRIRSDPFTFGFDARGRERLRRIGLGSRG